MGLDKGAQGWGRVASVAIPVVEGLVMSEVAGRIVRADRMAVGEVAGREVVVATAVATGVASQDAWLCYTTTWHVE